MFKDVFDMEINISLDCKSDSKICELREDLKETFELFCEKVDECIYNKEELHNLFYNFKTSFYPHKEKFSDICIAIEDSILLTDDEINDILGIMKLDLENMFFSNDEIFYDNEHIKDIMNKKFLSFDKKLTELYEKINT
jgi:hypothetical protein